MASCTYNRLPKFFIQWEKVQLVFPYPLNSIKHQTYICTTILWIVIISITAGNSYIIFGNRLQSVLLGTVPVDHPQINIIKVAKVMVGVFSAVAWIAPSVFMFMVAKILSQEFIGITREIRDSDGDKIKKSWNPYAAIINASVILWVMLTKSSLCK